MSNILPVPVHHYPEEAGQHFSTRKLVCYFYPLSSYNLMEIHVKGHCSLNEPWQEVKDFMGNMVFILGTT